MAGATLAAHTLPSKMESQGEQRVISIRMRNWASALILVAAISVGGTQAEGQLRWPDPPKKSPIRVRIVALALALPRSSFFPSYEVLVAETEISHDEWSLIKLVFTYLPYQPRLSESGFDYSVVHEVSASRNPDCDETVEQLTARSQPDRHEPLIYSRNVPREDLDRRRIPLPCYETNADDYIKSSLEPIGPPPEPPEPVLKERPKPSEPVLKEPPNPAEQPVLKERPNPPETAPKEPPNPK